MDDVPSVSSPRAAGQPHSSSWRLLRSLAQLDAASLSSARLTLRAWCELALVLLLFYCCDRTALSAGGAKSYSRDFFAFLSLALLAAAALGSTHSCKQPTLLNRDQTEEWKGWMQVLFLLYHYFEAKELYNAIRIFIAGYVFLTGFGNFSYYHVRADFSCGRFAQMLWRLNFFVFFACCALNNSYVLYYICPMHTLFTVVIYAALAVRSAANRTGAGVATKLALCLLGCAVMWDVPGVFKAVWRPLSWLVGYVDPRQPALDALHEWQFRTGLDRYVWVYGMLCAYAHPACERSLERLDGLRGVAKHAARAAVLATCLAIGSIWYTQVYSLPKLAYNAMHPYTSFIPLTLWIVVRNLWPPLRAHYLELFAYLGKITLETYICQFHIWLHTGRPDGQPGQLLVLIEGYPLVNFLCATGVYVLVSKRMFEVTNSLKNACVPLADNKLLAANAALGCALALGLFVVAAALLTL